MVDAIILYESTETEFLTNGLGILSDASKCEIEEERNGAFELTMTYPIHGNRYSELALRRIILAKPNPYDRAQPFRIYNISTPINGMVTVNAEHISYDLSGIPVSPFTAGNVIDALAALERQSVIPNPFKFTTDKSTVANMKCEKPSSIRSLLGGTQGSILDVYTGEYIFDRFNVTLKNNRGNDNGVCIRYGKNLTDIEQEKNCNSVYTGVYPYWYSENDGLVEVSGKIVKASGTYDFERILPLDLTSEYTEKPTADQIKTKAESYITKNKIGVPKVSIDVSFVTLSQDNEYELIEQLERVCLCDTVSVEFPEIGVSSTAKCIKTKYDAVSGKYISIELGDARSNLATTISSTSQAVSNVISSSEMNQAIAHATSLITGGLGGYVILRSSLGGKQPDELLIMDTDDITTAKNVWRFNKGGLGHSSNGYNGPFDDVALTMDGYINGKKITGLSVSANDIKAGTLRGITIIGSTFKNSDTNPTFSVDQNGRAIMKSANVGGFEVGTSSITSSTSTMSAAEYGSGSGSMRYYGDSLYLVANGGGMVINGTKITPSGSPKLGYRNNTWAEVYSDYLWSGGDIQAERNCDIDGWLTVHGALYARGDLDVNGDFSVSGEKNRIINTKNYGVRKLNAYETASPYFGDIGEGIIGSDGKCYIYIDDIFSETVNLIASYQVFIQSYSDKQCYVSERLHSYFVVNGTPGTTFAWEIKAIQKDANAKRLDEYQNSDVNRDAYNIETYMRKLSGQVESIADVDAFDMGANDILNELMKEIISYE